MRQHLLLIVTIFLSSVSYAQDMKSVRKHIDTLCSPYMAGRGYIDQGDHKAAEYLASQFEKIGLKSFGDDYFQPFSFPVNTFPGDLKLKLDRRTLITGQDYIMNPVSSACKGRKKIVYIDTVQLSDPEYKEKFLKSNFKNKVIAYKRDDFKFLTKLPIKYIQKLFSAKAVIERTNKLTASISTKATKSCIFEVQDSLLANSPKRAKFVVENKMIDKHTTQNVIGYIEGTQHPDQYLVISAHYDHLGKMGNAFFAGANDNASGTSMLIELAKHYQQHPPKYSIVFIAFAAEEAGLLGSMHLVQHPLFDLSKIKFLINLDIVGTGGEGITIVNGSVFDKAFKKIQKINQDQQLLPSIQKRGAAANSDHYFFYKKGVPCFFIYTRGGIKAYHDVFDRKETLPLTAFPKLFRLIITFFDSF